MQGPLVGLENPEYLNSGKGCEMSTPKVAGLLVIMALLLALTACGQEVVPTATLVPTPSPAAAGPPPEGLFLKITRPPRESVVRTSAVLVGGITSPDAVVSVNGVLVDVDEKGRFTSTVSLQEGPNLIEAVASDFHGNQVSSVLTIIYIP